MAVSVIIKTLNEEEHIAKAIESAIAATAFCQAEIIIADSGSTDNTIKIASSYPVKIVQLSDPKRASCGIGAQLGYQYAQYEFVCLMDGDMHLDADFVQAGVSFLQEQKQMAGVTGHIIEMQLENLEYQRRVARNAPEKNIGAIDRMNGGGLFRRSAIEDLGYLTDQNLHAYEEYELGYRLRMKGWLLWRLDQPFSKHYGHMRNAYSLVLQRWHTGYLRGSGEVMRAHSGWQNWAKIVKELPEIRLWCAIYLWWLVVFLTFLYQGFHFLPFGILIAPFLIMIWKKRNFGLGIYSVVAWNLHAIAFIQGLLSKRRNPAEYIDAHIIK